MTKYDRPLDLVLAFGWVLMFLVFCPHVFFGKDEEGVDLGGFL